MREWKELLISGLPLYEPIKGQQPGFELPTSLNPVELKKQEKLNNLDYDEYTVSWKHECSTFSKLCFLCQEKPNIVTQKLISLPVSGVIRQR